MRRMLRALPALALAGSLAWAPVAQAQPKPAPSEEQPPPDETAAPVEDAPPADDATGARPGAADAPEAPLEPEPEPEPDRPPEGLSVGARTAWDAGQLVDEGQLSAAEAKASLALTQPGHFQLARVRTRQGRTSDALDHVRQAVDADALYAPAQVLRVRLLDATGDVQSALASLEALAAREPDALGVRLALAEAQLASGRPTDAMDTARSVLKRAETSVTAMKLLARAYLAVDNLSAAQAILERALELDNDAQAFLLRGQIALGRDEIVRARAWFERAVEADAAHPEALNNLGYTYLEVRNFEAALEVLDEAVELAPGYALAWLNLGSARRGLQRFDAAESAWKQTLNLDPDLADGWFNLGILYLENDVGGRDRIQRYQAAIDAFNEYKQSARPTGEDLKELDSYIDEARLLLDREKQRKQEQLKQVEEPPVEQEEAPVEGDEAPADEVPPADDETAPEGAPEEEVTPEEAPPGDEGAARVPRRTASTPATEVPAWHA